MDTTMVPEARYIKRDLPEWGIATCWVLPDDGGQYMAIRAQCGELGITHQRQLEKIADDYPEGLREFRVATEGGRQVIKCLRRADAALWLATIHPGKVRADLRETFEDIRAAIMRAIEPVLFGDNTGVRAVATIQPRGGDVHLGGCPKCHTPLRVQYGPEGITLYIAEG